MNVLFFAEKGGGRCDVKKRTNGGMEVVGTSKEEKKGKGWMVSPVSWLLRGERKKKEQEVVESQANGTGYSSYQNMGWDVNAYMAAQKDKDKQIQLVLEKICIGRATT